MAGKLLHSDRNLSIGELRRGWPLPYDQNFSWNFRKFWHPAGNPVHLTISLVSLRLYVEWWVVLACFDPRVVILLGRGTGGLLCLCRLLEAVQQGARQLVDGRRGRSDQGHELRNDSRRVDRWHHHGGWSNGLLVPRGREPPVPRTSLHRF